MHLLPFKIEFRTVLHRHWNHAGPTNIQVVASNTVIDSKCREARARTVINNNPKNAVEVFLRDVDGNIAICVDSISNSGNMAGAKRELSSLGIDSFQIVFYNGYHRAVILVRNRLKNFFQEFLPQFFRSLCRRAGFLRSLRFGRGAGNTGDDGRLDGGRNTSGQGAERFAKKSAKILSLKNENSCRIRESKGCRACFLVFPLGKLSTLGDGEGEDAFFRTTKSCCIPRKAKCSSSYL